MPGQVLSRGVKRENIVEEGVVGKDLGQFGLDQSKVDADARPVKFGSFDNGLDLEGVAVDPFALAPVFFQEMGGLEFVPDAKFPAHRKSIR